MVIPSPPNQNALDLRRSGWQYNSKKCTATWLNSPERSGALSRRVAKVYGNLTQQQGQSSPYAFGTQRPRAVSSVEWGCSTLLRLCDSTLQSALGCWVRLPYSFRNCIFNPILSNLRLLGWGGGGHWKKRKTYLGDVCVCVCVCMWGGQVGLFGNKLGLLVQEVAICQEFGGEKERDRHRGRARA